MLKYGFNENEIVSTQTIMVDKDGYHKVVEGASDGGSNADEHEKIIGFLYDQRSNGNVGVYGFNMDEDISANAVTVHIALNPYNSVHTSDYVINTVVDDDYMTHHNFITPQQGYMKARPMNDDVLVVNGKLYDQWLIAEKDAESDDTTYISLLENDIENYIFGSEESGTYAKFDLSYIVLDPSNHIIGADVVHVITPIISGGSPK